MNHGQSVEVSDVFLGESSTQSFIVNARMSLVTAVGRIANGFLTPLLCFMISLRSCF